MGAIAFSGETLGGAAAVDASAGPASSVLPHDVQ